MGLMELGCTLEDFGRPAQPAASNRLRCRAQVVSERYLRENLRDSCVLFVAYAWYHIDFWKLPRKLIIDHWSTSYLFWTSAQYLAWREW